MSLRLDWATQEATKFACTNWHYSKTVPTGKLVKIGIWEDGKFVGVIIFGDGVLGSGKTVYGVSKMFVGELVRVAMKTHKTPVSRCLSIAIKFLRKKCPKLKLLVSFSDMSQGHHGGIYQASNWWYVGPTEVKNLYKHKITGKTYNDRSISDTGFVKRKGKYSKAPTYKDVYLFREYQKHRYILPLTDDMRLKFKDKVKPYPKRATSIDNDASTLPGRRGRCDSDRSAPLLTE